VTLDTYTFDGILGTNHLFGSGDLSALSGFPVPFREGPFEWLVLDLASEPPTLGLLFEGSFKVPELSSGARLLAMGLLAVLGTRFVRARSL
jgi:hypothetical protein